MKEAGEQAVKQVEGAKRWRRKCWVLLLVMLVVAAVFCFRQHRLNEQMKLDEQLRVLASDKGRYSSAGGKRVRSLF